MRHRDRTNGFLSDPPASRPPRQRRVRKRLLWRDLLVSSRLYGRSRWLHSLGEDESEAEQNRPAGEG